jgi:hypothetical protein
MNLSNPGVFLHNTDKIRIAVCFSGQSRYWKEAAENIKSFFNHTHHPEHNLPIEVDYFIHTWNMNTWRMPKQHHQHFKNVYHNHGPLIEAEFKPKAMEFEHYELGRFIRAWDPMFYSFAKSLMLKREYELQNNFQYDAVVKARLDVVYNPLTKFPLSRVEPKFCYTSNISNFPLEFNYYNFDDVIFYGDSPTMDLVGDLYHTYKVRHTRERLDNSRKQCNLDETSFYGPGALLYDHMTSIGIHPERRPAFDYAVMRSTIVDAKINPMTQFEEVRRLWREWYI